jgi:hypothetical protein
VRWPWSRRNDEDAAALEDAERHLSEVRDQWPRVRAEAANMNRHREINGFTERIRTAMGVTR